MAENQDAEVIKDSSASESEGNVVENTDDSVKESDDKQEVVEVDYAAELEKERKLRGIEVAARKKAEDKIVQMKREAKADNADDDESDPYGINELVDGRVNEKVDSIRKELVGDVINDELEKLTSNTSERELILFHYENTIKQSGSSRKNIVSDLEKALLLANHKKIVRESQEALNTASNKSGISNVSGGSNQDKLRPETEHKFNPQELALLARRGIDPKTVTID